jgi:hypothetical protein
MRKSSVRPAVDVPLRSVVAVPSRTAYARVMRFTLPSLAILGLVVPACADDGGEDGTSMTTSPLPMTTANDTTDGDTATLETETDSVSATEGSTTGDTDSLDDSTTGAGIVCGDDMVEGDELCDGTAVGEETCVTQGFDEGELGCLADCTGYDTSACLTAVCGDGVAVGKELCDGLDTAEATCESEGFDSGTLACTKDCATLDTSGCGTCGNNQVDGGETCDGVWLQGQDCLTQGFDSGTIACMADCAAYDTAGCGLCGNEILDGAELCDGVDLGASDCTTLGFTGGMLVCEAGCGTFDVYGCGVQQFDVSAPTVMGGAVDRFRGNGYTADADGVLVDFSMYLGLAAPCDLDFYVYEAPMYGGPYTQVARTTTVAAAVGVGYYTAGIPLVPVTAGSYYVLGAAWTCSVTSYWNSSGAFAGADGGIGLFNVSHWDNAYPGPSDMYLPPNVGTVNTVYAQQVFFGE